MTPAPPPATADRFRLLYQLGCAFAARMELDELIPLVMNTCREVIGAEGASVVLLDPVHDELYFPYVATEDPDVAARLLRTRFPAGRGIAGSVVRSGQAVRVDAVAHDPRFYPNVDRHTGTTTQSLLCAPLRSHQGTIGVLQVVNPLGSTTFTDDDLGLLEALAGSVAVAIENARMFGAMKASAERLSTQVGALRSELARRDRAATMVGTAASMAEVFHLIERAAAVPITVLIEGETGVGKELVARAIHAGSARAEAPFVAVNCAALPEELLESALFGHRRGSFTGALQDHRGLFEAAQGGTLLLDEIGEMPAAMQAKLLRVLQEREIVPVGDVRPRAIDVRVISATNRDLSTRVAAREFRDDLYYRVSAFPIRVPPLRARRDDIPLLVDRFLRTLADQQHRPVPGVASEALAMLFGYDWPGNVRELQNEIERAMALVTDGDRIQPEHLSPRLRSPSPTGDGTTPELPVPRSPEPVAAADVSLRGARAGFERQFIETALRQHAGNVSRTARAIGLSRAMLQRKMREYSLRT